MAKPDMVIPAHRVTKYQYPEATKHTANYFELSDPIRQMCIAIALDYYTRVISSSLAKEMLSIHTDIPLSWWLKQLEEVLNG